MARTDQEYLEEIERTGKYPKEFLYLKPWKFRKNDSSFLLDQVETSSELFDCELEINPKYLGLNKKKAQVDKGNQMDYGYLYVLKAAGTSLYKIGISSDFYRRFNDLSAASPLPLVILKCAQCDHPNILESHLHNMFSDKLFKNEWYQLEDDELLDCLSEIDRFYNV